VTVLLSRSNADTLRDAGNKRLTFLLSTNSISTMLSARELEDLSLNVPNLSMIDYQTRLGNLKKRLMMPDQDQKVNN